MKIYPEMGSVAELIREQKWISSVESNTVILECEVKLWKSQWIRLWH